MNKCEECHEYFKPIKNNYARFCSKKCNEKNWRNKNKEKIKIKRAKYYKKNKEKEKKLCAKWYKKNRDSKIRTNKEYRELNRDLFSQYRDNNRFDGKRKTILSRDENSCSGCRSEEDLCVHHKDNTGDTDRINNNSNNLITLCRSCHTKLHHWQKKNKILSNNTDIIKLLKEI